MADEPLFVDCQCSRCGELAARFEAVPAGHGEGLLANRDRLVRTGWFGTLEQPLDLGSGGALLERIREGDLTPLAREDPDLFGFFCRSCGQGYCHACWKLGPPEFDDGLYDCTRGVCPAGHQQVVDD